MWARYNSDNMQAPPLGKRVLDPNSFFLYVANHRNTTEGMSVVHNALWARRYAQFAEQAGLNYATYCELPASRKSSASGSSLISLAHRHRLSRDVRG